MRARMNLGRAVRFDIGRVGDRVHGDIIRRAACATVLDVGDDCIPVNHPREGLVNLNIRICFHRDIGHGICSVVDLVRRILENLEDQRCLRNLRPALNIRMCAKVKVA